MVIHALTWFATIVALAGNIFVIYRKRAGFLLWVISNIFFVANGIALARQGNTEQLATSFLFAVYTALAIWGYVSWGVNDTMNDAISKIENIAAERGYWTGRIESGAGVECVVIKDQVLGDDEVISTVGEWQEFDPEVHKEASWLKRTNPESPLSRAESKRIARSIEKRTRVAGFASKAIDAAKQREARGVDEICFVNIKTKPKGGFKMESGEQ